MANNNQPDIFGLDTDIDEYRKFRYGKNKIIPERSLVIGSPGKVIRQVTDEEIKHIKENASHYVNNYKKYKNLGN